MRWEQCTLIGKIKTGEDLLHNPVYEEKAFESCMGRFTPWSNEEVQLEGREVTMNQRKLLLRLPFSCFPDCEKVGIGGVTYEITPKTVDLTSRFTLLYVKAYKE